ncbi:polysaccharide biosynthesis protein [Fibrisoma limi BUZ 3]|uniref:Polysaccharide biosynthesis protein n=1 Tax=Fibrisoma limi BUZ 3 TaxID=1185876 RepID=I2GPZ9_9BACT|nr:lipopolysaccharide biosynthesis protein [Fibrisoma limi]CCH55977.1 polysaccharide biosynthesis protein [Fibrisoma limi BUZ 3]
MQLSVKRLSQLLRSNAVISLMGNGASAVLGFVMLGVLTRIMPKDELGRWLLFLTYFTLFDVVRNGFVLNGFIRHAASEHTNAPVFRRWVGAAWQLSALLTGSIALFILGLAVFVPLIAQSGLVPADWFSDSGTSSDGFGWFLTLMLVSMPASHSMWFWHAQSRFTPIQIIRPGIQALQLILIGIGWAKYGQLSSTWLYQSYALAYGSVSVGVVLFGGSRLRDVRRGTRTERRALFDFGKFSTGTLLLSNLLRSSSTFLISAFLGPAAVTVYTLPQRLLELVEMPTRSIVITAIPQLVALHQQQKVGRFADEFHRYAGQLWIALLPVAVGGFIFAEPLVTLLGGSGYEDSVLVLRFFMIYAALLPLERYSGVGLDALGLPNRNLQKVIIMLLVNVVGTVIALYLFKSVASVAFVSIATFLSGLLLGFRMMKPYAAVSLPTTIRVGWQQGSYLLNRVRHEFAR